MSRIVSDKQFFNPYPYTNPTGTCISAAKSSVVFCLLYHYYLMHCSTAFVLGVWMR